MAIKWVPDLGAPVAVAAVDMAVQAWKPEWSKWITGLMAVGGYVGGALMKEGTGEQFVKNIGIASLPAFAKDMVNMIKGVSSQPASAVTFRRAAVPMTPIASHVSQTPGPGFQNLQRTY
jgi:hypothetical protein